LPLAHRFLAFYARAFSRRPPTLSPATEQLLTHYPWPGNVRELQNAIERALILWPGDIIEPAAFPDRMRTSAAPAAPVTPTPGAPPGPQLGGDHTLADIERAHILQVIDRSSSLDAAAETLGIDASTLWRKRKKFEEG
jgi:NtrC-family two-component system response regulator AlgB